jgi:hypothetical protein
MSDHGPTRLNWVPHGDFAVAAMRAPVQWWNEHHSVRFIVGLSALVAIFALMGLTWAVVRHLLFLGVFLAVCEVLGVGPRRWVVVALRAHELQVGQIDCQGRPALGAGFTMPKQATRIAWTDIQDLRVDDQGLVIERRGAEPLRIALLDADREPLFAELLARWTRTLENLSDTPVSAERARRLVESLR